MNMSIVLFQFPIVHARSLIYHGIGGSLFVSTFLTIERTIALFLGTLCFRFLQFFSSTENNSKSCKNCQLLALYFSTFIKES